MAEGIETAPGLSPYRFLGRRVAAALRQKPELANRLLLDRRDFHVLTAFMLLVAMPATTEELEGLLDRLDANPLDLLTEAGIVDGERLYERIFSDLPDVILGGPVYRRIHRLTPDLLEKARVSGDGALTHSALDFWTSIAELGRLAIAIAPPFFPDFNRVRKMAEAFSEARRVGLLKLSDDDLLEQLRTKETTSLTQEDVLAVFYRMLIDHDAPAVAVPNKDFRQIRSMRRILEHSPIPAGVRLHLFDMLSGGCLLLEYVAGRRHGTTKLGPVVFLKSAKGFFLEFDIWGAQSDDELIAIEAGLASTYPSLKCTALMAVLSETCRASNVHDFAFREHFRANAEGLDG